jgi:hypothetical protein
MNYMNMNTDTGGVICPRVYASPRPSREGECAPTNRTAEYYTSVPAKHARLNRQLPKEASVPVTVARYHPPRHMTALCAMCRYAHAALH